MKKSIRIEKNCLECGKLMFVPPCYFTRKKYCSRTCLGKHHSIHNLRINTEANKASFKKGEHLGKDHPRYVDSIEFVCKNCGEKFYRKPWIVRHSKNPIIYCSLVCRDTFRRKHESGENSPYWVGGAQTYRGRNWQRIRLVVVNEQNGVCAHCGKFVGKSLPVNHIKPFREFDNYEEANRRENLIGLCQSCHMKAEPRRKKC